MLRIYRCSVPVGSVQLTYPQPCSPKGRSRQFFPTGKALRFCYSAGAMKVSEALEPFINSCRAERDVSATSIAKYRDCFRVWILPWLGERDLTEVNRMEVLAMRN